MYNDDDDDDDDHPYIQCAKNHLNLPFLITRLTGSSSAQTDCH